LQSAALSEDVLLLCDKEAVLCAIKKCVGQVVISRAFFFILLHNHIINIKKYFSFSGDVNYEANFSFFILLHKRAKPIAPPYVHFSYPNLLSTFANPPIRPYLHPPPLCDAVGGAFYYLVLRMPNPCRRQAITITLGANETTCRRQAIYIYIVIHSSAPPSVHT
jgi:hypothetical protein